MSYLRYAARMYNSPLLISSDKARILEQVVRAHEEGRASLLSPPPVPAPRRELAAPGVVRADGGYLRTSNGIAVIQMVGTFVQRGGDEQLDAMSGLIAYGSLGQQMLAAENDPRVDAILAEIDSNGGEVPGLVDFVSRMRSAATKKPVWAIANEQAFSAGMWVASAASKLFVPSTGMVGSIGVRMLHVDQSQRDAKQGLVYTEIVAGDRKADFSTHAPLSDPARAAAQEEVDRIYSMFTAAVADHRGIDEQAVRDTQAGLLNAEAALALGLIDGIQSFDETLAQLSAEAQHVRFNGMRRSARANAPATPETISQGEDTMAAQDTNATAAQLAEAEARGRTAAETENAKKVAEAQTKAAADAQLRISAILTHAEADGRSKLAQHLAFKTNTSVEDAIAMLAASDKATGKAANPLAEAMGKIPNPKVGADTGVDDEPKKATVIGANDLFAKRRAQAGHGGK